MVSVAGQRLLICIELLNFLARWKISSRCAMGCDLVLAVSISSIFSYPYFHPVADCVFFLVFPSLLFST